jgi:3-deoxy-D-manno-octulosonic-acid transferase
MSRATGPGGRAGDAFLTTYRILTTLLSPAAPAWLRRRAGQGREEAERVGERFGHPGRDRPPGDLVWAHGASIGETLALLPIVEALVERGLAVLVTSGTRTSAEILARRLPPGARHQYLPLDVPRFVGRFLEHWRPSLALFAESELWPAAIHALAKRKIPLVLVNGRLSVRSAALWARLPRAASAMLGRFTLCLAQSEGDAERLARAGAPNVAISGNLKFDVAPPPAEAAAVEALAAALAGRPVWIAASTHPGEEESVFAAHRALVRAVPRLLTVVAPRHPARGASVAALATEAGLDANRRSLGHRPDWGTDIHVADTVGELGLFFRAVPLVFMGGSLVPHGGQNPIEPARLGAAILHGPHVANFEEAYDALDGSGGALLVEDADRLAAAVGALLGDAGLIRDMARAGGDAVARLGGALDRTLAAIEPLLPPPRPGHRVDW